MSRFEDTLQRDLTVIADRATPSPHAWQQIQRRITDQDPPQETEIIMLTDNTTRPRRWPVLAAAAAVLALVIGGVALVNRGDDAENPADDPTPQPTILPTPDDATEPDVDTPVSELRTVTFSGEDERVVSDTADDSNTADEPETGAFEVTGSMTAEGIRFETVSTGEYVAQSETVVDGTSRTVLTGSIDGIGSGSITAEGEWSRRNGIDDSIYPITDASGAFEGATGTLRNITDAATDRGTWTMELTLPADRFTSDFVEPVTAAGPATEPAGVPAELVSGLPATAGVYTTDALGTELTFEVADAADGTWQAVVSAGTVWLQTGDGDEFVQMTRIGGWYDATEAADPNTTGFGSIAAGDVDGFIEARDDLDVNDIGTVTVDGRAARLFEFGLNPASDAGEGICDPGVQPCTWIASRSKDAPGPDGGRANALLGDRLVRAWVIDMDGYEPILVEGSTTRDDKEAWLDDVLDPIVDSMAIFGSPTYAVPGGTASLATEVVATGTWTDAGYTEVPLDDGSFDVSYVTTLDGDLRGESTPIEAFRIPDESGGSIGGGVMEFTGEIDGLGTGTLQFREEYVSLPVFLSVGVIVGGTGDFEGVTGWALFNPDNAAGTYEFHLEVPHVMPPVTPRETLDLESSFEVAGLTETGEVDGEARLTATTDFSGDVSGGAPTVVLARTEDGGTTRGAGRRTLSAGIDGIGTGILFLEGPWRSDADGNYIGLANIVGGTDDFAGADGTVRFQSTDGGATGTAEFTLQLPTS